jgi:CheY-like chemotaxis protein
VATILVTDDNPDAIDVMDRILRSWGHRPLTAPTGEAALALLSAEKVDLVIVDGMMPGMNGVELIRLMRANPQTAGIPAVLFTALVQSEFHQNAIAKGATECWIKGDIEYDQIKERIESLLARPREV